MPIDLFLLVGVITPLACARLWRILAKDEVSWWLRKRLIVRLPNAADGRQHWILRGWECPFCLGFWLTAVAVPVVWFWHPVPVIIALAILAGSHITGLAQKG